MSTKPLLSDTRTISEFHKLSGGQQSLPPAVSLENVPFGAGALGLRPPRGPSTGRGETAEGGGGTAGEGEGGGRAAAARSPGVCEGCPNGIALRNGRDCSNVNASRTDEPDFPESEAIENGMKTIRHCLGFLSIGTLGCNTSQQCYIFLGCVPSLWKIRHVGKIHGICHTKPPREDK